MRMALSNLSVKNYNNYLNYNALFFSGSPESGWPTELKSRIQTDTSVIIGTVLNTFLISCCSGAHVHVYKTVISKIQCNIFAYIAIISIEKHVTVKAKNSF